MKTKGQSKVSWSYNPDHILHKNSPKWLQKSTQVRCNPKQLKAGLQIDKTHPLQGRGLKRLPSLPKINCTSNCKKKSPKEISVKFQDFSITQILREIEVSESGVSKMAILTHLEALNLDFLNFYFL